MASVAGQVRDERTARMVLSMIDDPDDPMTGSAMAGERDRHVGLARRRWPGSGP